MTRKEQRDNTINDLHKKRTSPKTIQIQNSKTARSQAEWLHISTEGQGTYDVGSRAMKRDRLANKKLRAKQQANLR
jgi:hypothetical protein